MSKTSIEIIHGFLTKIRPSVKEYLSVEELAKMASIDVPTARAIAGDLYQAGYFLKNENKQFKVNPEVGIEQMLELAVISITAEDFAEISPIPKENRQSFRYMKEARTMALKNQAEKNALSDERFINLENLALASMQARDKYILEIAKKDSKLASLIQMSKLFEKSYMDYLESTQA